MWGEKLCGGGTVRGNMCEGNVLHSNAETYRLAVKADTFFIVVQVPDDAASFLPFVFFSVACS